MVRMLINVTQGYYMWACNMWRWDIKPNHTHLRKPTTTSRMTRLCKRYALRVYKYPRYCKSIKYVENIIKEHSRNDNASLIKRVMYRTYT